MKKRILSLLLALVMLLGMLPTVALAADDGWDGTTTTPVTPVDGVYQISTAAELAWFRDEVNSGKSTLNATLTADIDLNNKEWEPIGKPGGFDMTTYQEIKAAPFTGTFDGQMHTIRGLKIDRTVSSTAAIGLFGYLEAATIQNLTVYGDVKVTLGDTSWAQYSVGGVVGQTTGATLYRVASYVNVNSTNKSSCASAVGGLVANGVSVEITECANLGNVTSNDTGSHANVGGLTGVTPPTSYRFSCTIKDSFNVGTISGTATIGGIAPLPNGPESKKSSIENCYTIGEAFGEMPNSESATITNCFATANTIGATGVTEVSQSDLNGETVLAALGSAFKAGTNYPILTWMTESGAPEQPGECTHTNTETSYTSKHDGTHTVTVTCNDCHAVVSTTSEPCSTADGKCTKCGYCPHTHKKTTYAQNEDGTTHTVTVTCTDCNEKVSETDNVACTKREDGHCVCGRDLSAWPETDTDGYLKIATEANLKWFRRSGQRRQDQPQAPAS